MQCYSKTTKLVKTVKTSVLIQIMARKKLIVTILVVILTMEILYYSGITNNIEVSIKQQGMSYMVLEQLNKIREYKPLIYVITPTYYRYAQRADLTRLSNTLRLVENIHWIVIEDNNVTKEQVNQLLNTSTIPYTYLANKSDIKNKNCGKGSIQRNLALDWIIENHNQKLKAVVYFADDDNAYHTDIFEQMRFTKVLSMWPVGLAGGHDYETPVVKDGKVTHFIGWGAKQRVFATDMAGFAINVELLWKFHQMRFDPKSDCGFLETKFLEICCALKDVEPLADNCTKVLVWHTKTGKPIVWNKLNKLVV